MAVYFDLAVDCGFDEKIADKLTEHFNELTLHLPQLVPVICKTMKGHKRGLWFVSIWPEGMGYATHPVCHPELASITNQQLIKNILYEHLKGLTGFRRALFGGEACDCFFEATDQEDNDIDYVDMIFSSTVFPAPDHNLTLTPFSDGYLIVTGKNI